MKRIFVKIESKADIHRITKGCKMNSETLDILSLLTLEDFYVPCNDWLTKMIRIYYKRNYDILIDDKYFEEVAEILNNRLIGNQVDEDF